MESRTSELIDELAHNHTLDLEGYEHLVTHQDDEAAQRLADLASGVRKDVYGTDVFVRGLIEISSICKNDCLYCGLRASNASCERYRLTP